MNEKEIKFHLTNKFYKEYTSVWAKEFSITIYERKKDLFDDFFIQWKFFLLEIQRRRIIPFFIEISIIRQSLLENSMPKWRIQAIDKNSLFSEVLFESEIEVDCFSEIFLSKKNEFFKEGLKYIGKIPLPIVKKELLKTIPRIDKFIADIFIEKSDIMLSEFDYDALTQKADIQCSFGEYRRFQTNICERRL